MSWYKNYKTEWKQIIETVASEIKRSNVIVEKDLIQSLFLYELSKEELPFVFKGGTSLSKIYGIIDRFSEDIDYEKAINNGIRKILETNVFDYKKELKCMKL